MELQNTTLDDLAAVIGFSATLRLAAWFGDRGNVYVPDTCEDGQLLVKLIGLSAAKKLTEEWGHQHLNIPRLKSYENDLVKRQVGRMFEHSMRSTEIANQLRMSERRVQQICRELEAAGLIQIVAPKTVQKNALENDRRKSPRNLPQENAGKNAPQNTPVALPVGFFGQRKVSR